MANYICPVKKAFDSVRATLADGRIAHSQCRERLASLLKLLDDISQGRAEKDHIASLRSLAAVILDEGLDRACIDTGRMVLRVLEENPDVFRSHVETHYCPTGECTVLCAAPCQLACPANVDAPSYVALIGMGRYEDALEVLREDLPIPGSLGRVCVHPCESACRRGEVDAPIAICQLKRAAFDKASAESLAAVEPAPHRHEEKIAIVGSGPAGLSAGYFLAKMGYRPLIFEAMPEAGGMLRWGIPAYRLPRDILRMEIDVVRSLGVEIKTNARLGQGLNYDWLKQQGYKAVFLAVGAWRSMPLNIRGVQDNPNVIDCLRFLRREDQRQDMIGRQVIVIGGGNAAVDCLRTALRLDVDNVHLVYRRSRREMPAHEAEIEAAEDEGAVLSYLSSPIRVHSEQGKVVGLECIQNELSEPDATGRRRPIPVEGSEHLIPADTIITAIGQQVEKAALSSIPALELAGNDLIRVDPLTMETSIPGLFAGGDVVTGPATVVEAVAAGRKASESIHRFLKGLPHSDYGLLPARRRLVPVMSIPAGQRAFSARPAMPHLRPDERIQDFQEVERGLSSEDAVREAKRCLRCDICISCGRCVEVCRGQMDVGALHLSYVAESGTEHTDLLRTADQCIGCAACATHCPTGALVVSEENGRRIIRMCGAEMSRHELVSCASCGHPVTTEKHLAYIREKADNVGRLKYPRDLCPSCARKIRAETIREQIPVY